MDTEEVIDEPEEEISTEVVEEIIPEEKVVEEKPKKEKKSFFKKKDKESEEKKIKTPKSKMHIIPYILLATLVIGVSVYHIRNKNKIDNLNDQLNNLFQPSIIFGEHQSDALHQL